MSNEPVVLRNRNRYKSFSFTMYHAIVCQDGHCYCGRQAKMGTDERGEFVRAEQSVFIPPRGQSEPLPPVVLKVPQVRCALAEPNFLELVGVLAEVQVVTAAQQLAAASPAPAPTFIAASQQRVAQATRPKVGPRGR